MTQLRETPTCLGDREESWDLGQLWDKEAAPGDVNAGSPMLCRKEHSMGAPAVPPPAQPILSPTLSMDFCELQGGGGGGWGWRLSLNSVNSQKGDI